MADSRGWGQPDEALGRRVQELFSEALGAYRSSPLLILEQAGHEDNFRTGGYAKRPVLELVQNAADALRRSGRRGRVKVMVREGVLYCANQGAPFDTKGLEAITHAYISDKDGDEMGRFGLGFKSVLALSDAPLVLNKAVSFKFSAQASREALSDLAPDSAVYPVLRLPTVADDLAEIAQNPVLGELAEWSDTVICLPLARDSGELLSQMKSFPKEFPLFASYVSELELSWDEGCGNLFRCEPLGEDRYRLLVSSSNTDDRDATVDRGDIEGTRKPIVDSTDWLVLHQTYRPTEVELAAVGQTIRRPEVTVTYAAPLDDVQTLGRFWAYFPLQDSTSARGIHNAPWHVSDDRTNLLDGAFNQGLLKVTADLIVSALPRLSTVDDPARSFDYLPAREREADNFADRRLIELVPELARRTRSVPDVDGVLRIPSDLEYLTADLAIDVESIELWNSAPGRPVRSPHQSCYRTQTRKARLRRLVRGDGNRAAPNELMGSAWLERIVAGGRDDQCDVALQVYMSVGEESTRRALRQAAVVPDTSGALHRIEHTDRVFLRGNPLSASAGIRLVRPTLLDLPGVEDSLRAIDFHDVDPASELRRLATTAASRWTGPQWQEFWNLVLEVSSHDAEEILLQHVLKDAALKVRCRDGSWQHVGTVVVPGRVEPAKPSLAVDVDFHQLHLGLLRSIGVADRPVVTETAKQDMTLSEYRRLVRAAYLEPLPPRGRPDPASIDFREKTGPTPLHVLRSFADSRDDESRARWTKFLLEVDGPDTWVLQPPDPNRFPAKSVTAPHLWAAQRYGLLDTAWGPREPARSLHPDLHDLSPLMPVATWPSAFRLTTVDKETDIPVNIWREFLTRVPAGGDPRRIGSLVVKALSRLPQTEIPERLPAVTGHAYTTVAPDELLIAVQDDEVHTLSDQGLAFIMVGDEQDAQALINAWGCRPASSMLRVEISPDTPGEPVVLLDRFRRLRDYADGALDGLELVGCNALHRVVTLPTGTDSSPEEFAVTGHTIYFEETLDDEELLSRISDRFGLDLDVRAIDRILGEAESARIQEAMALARTTRDPARRLLALLPAATLRVHLPEGLLETVREVSPDGGDLQIAQLLMHFFGDTVLHVLRHDLRAAGYEVPDTWAGSPLAMEAVRKFGFPAEFAGERNRRLDADITVLGPPDLKPLHDYQEELAGQIRGMLRPDPDPARALLFLPTGAGKTRVTVEALVRSINAREVDRPVLWIAQSEELCEQAVQTWMTVWRQFGERPLRLSRLWSRNEVAASDLDANVVVATDAKLDVVRKSDGYEWLRDAAIVVIDEAHGAIAQGITATLRWLGIDQRETARPLLGLTATPFAGTGDEANHRLAGRFFNNQFNVLGDDPYGELQRRGVLARTEHRIIKGSLFATEEADKAHFSKFKDVSNDMLARVGRDRERTLRLAEDIAEQPGDWPILVFTSSVLAAQTLAALLRVNKITSAAVSGATPAPERRRTVEAFRNGDIRVLTNCNVLTQGFDAPGVRALYIARPTFSPNLYIQMVGRGLRGPKNGGKPECLIVNVADTFETFGDQLAYKEFDHLWRYQGGAR
ncbi:sacsin N-terminal ATP-binding-like domain-containing protein [Actinoplanes sp. NPDC049265]|uniref:sacsin N-terminal ATP-binding-like domain-containing protein n=1 Tax=Actinoplanes sp. NPDC049265 TaxID=3363902 RepID=UPI003713AAA9